MQMKTIHIIPRRFLQKPSKASKLKDNLKAQKGKNDLWSNGKNDELLFECEFLILRHNEVDRYYSYTFIRHFQRCQIRGIYFDIKW